jgi:hypothetical protein
VHDPLAPLRPALSRLIQSTYALRTTVAEDRPNDGAHSPDLKPFSALQESVDDLVDCVTEMHAVVDPDPAHGPSGSSVEAVRRGHELINTAGRLLREDLLGVDARFSHAAQVSGSWGGPWRSWSDVVLTGLVECRDGLGSMERALPDVWSALVVNRAPKESNR